MSLSVPFCSFAAVTDAGTVTTQGTQDAGNATYSPSGSGQQQVSGSGLLNPLGTTSLPQLITDILQLVVKIGAVIVVFMLVYVGFLFVVAQGSESKLEEAKRALLWTIVGALILLGAEAIAQGIQATVSALSG
jgi:hypothetical protein